MKLIVIDMQKGLIVDELYNKDKLVANITKLINASRKKGVEVIFVKHDAGANSGLTQGDPDFEIIDELKPLGNEKKFVKTINSAFGNKEFSNYLKETKEEELMIVGVQTEFCIDATIKSAFEKGYKVFVVKNSNSTFDNNYFKASKITKYYQEWIWDGSFATIVSVSDAIKLLK